MKVISRPALCQTIKMDQLANETYLQIESWLLFLIIDLATKISTIDDGH